MESKKVYVSEPYLNLDEPLYIDESVAEVTTHSYEPEMGSNLNNNGEIIITIENQDTFYFPSKSYLYVKGQLLKTDDKTYVDTDVITLVNNGIMYLFNRISYRLANQEIELINNPGQASTIKGLLSYPASYNKGLGLNSCWTLDDTIRQNYIIKKSNPKGYFSFIIPLSHIFGFCEDYKKLVYGMKHTLALSRANTDHDSIYRAAAAAAGKVRLDRICWYMPQVIPSDEAKFKLYKSIESKATYNIGYRYRQCDMTTVPQSTDFTWQLGARAAAAKPTWIIVAYQTNKSGSQEVNPSTFDHLNVTNTYVTLNAQRYPNNDLNLNFTQNDYSKIYQMASEFREIFYGIEKEVNDFQISPIEFKELFPLYVFDVRKQSERLKNSITDITIRAQFASNAPVNTEAYVLIISDRIIKMISDGNKLAIQY